MTDTERIQQLLLQRPGLSTQQVASELGLDRSWVASALHGLPAFVQDNSYRWWPRTRNGAPHAQPPRTLLATLCRYYLECLTRESGAAISLPAANEGEEYVTLDQLPFEGGTSVASQRILKKLLRKVRQERGHLTLHVGYALRLRLVTLPAGDEMRIEPILLYPVEDTPESLAEALRPSRETPLFNLEVLKSSPSADSGNLMDEAIHLSDELGLADGDDEPPRWDEIILRLRHCRPDWDWREELNPHALSKGVPLSELSEPGIYNRAVVFAAARSPFTYGLENELRKLEQLDDHAVANTALGTWLRADAETRPTEDQPILELLPLNAEQRQAVVQGMSAPLTVVTGPPGTGKSQVVVALLANMAYRGRSVLFASKNNHAVDVVESRANELAPHPLLLRLGREEHHARLAQHVAVALAESSAAGEPEGFQWLVRVQDDVQARFAEIQREIAALVAMRNEVDELERKAEPARALFGPELFRHLASTDLENVRRRLGVLGAALESLKSSEHGAVARFFHARGLRQVADAGLLLKDDAALLCVPFPGGPESIDPWDRFWRDMTARSEHAQRARQYWLGLERLRQARSLEQLSQELIRISAESASHSLDLWQRWMRLLPSRWDPGHRQVLSEYVSLLQMIASGDRSDEGPGRRVFRRYYELFPQVTKILPCWAVTSLSARGRLPFTPGLFDLVIIDEASQCDIASALPLLLRARRAVIIGDPLQLRHVSTVGPQQDRMILAAHGLAEGKAAWAYSVNSLFDLARSLCRHEDIVNLRDHHRSHRDIIAFSNRHYYRGTLRVATDHDRLKRPQDSGPAVRWVDVQGKVLRPSRGGAVNPVEAAAVVAEVRRLVIEQRYDGTIGVVTPFRAQANRIRTMAHQDVALSGALPAMEFVVDTVHGFQGDERDVIVFSPVVSAGIGESTLRFLKNHGNLFNVAITRARSELVVVGDQRASMESGVGYLESFAEYSRNLGSQVRGAGAAADLGGEYPAVAHPDLVSDWERVFYRAMYAAGLRPVPQYEEPPYTLDFAIFQGDRKLDVEVDGENYHRNWDGELCRRDQIRSRRLCDLGWEVLRFWVYEIRDDLDGCVERVRRVLG